MPGQTSSAYDLALIGRAAMQLPAFRTYVTTKTDMFPGGKGPDGKARRAFIINNHNRLLYNYPGTIGIKNGYTVAARQTFIGAASRGGHTYLLAEMAGTNASWRPKAALLDWAFAHGASLAPVGRLVDPGSVSRPSAARTPAPAAGAEATGRAPRPGSRGRHRGPGRGGRRRPTGLPRCRAAPLGRWRRPRRRGAAGHPPRDAGAPASPEAAAALQISSFCLICSLSPPHRLGIPAGRRREGPHSALSDHA